MMDEHGHNIAAHCHEPEHFASPVKHVCEMCHNRLRAIVARVEGLPSDRFSLKFDTPVARLKQIRDYLLGRENG